MRLLSNQERPRCQSGVLKIFLNIKKTATFYSLNTHFSFIFPHGRCYENELKVIPNSFMKHHPSPLHCSFCLYNHLDMQAGDLTFFHQTPSPLPVEAPVSIRRNRVAKLIVILQTEALLANGSSPPELPHDLQMGSHHSRSYRLLDGCAVANVSLDLKRACF